MKEVWLRMIRTFVTACGRCYGMGVIELPNGDTLECPICKGKGVL